MTGLAQLIAMQKAAKAGGHVQDTKKGLVGDDTTHSSDVDTTGGDAPVDSTHESKAPSAGGFRLNLAGRSGASVHAGDTSTNRESAAGTQVPAASEKPASPLARLAKMKVTAATGMPTPPPKPSPVESDGFTLEDLAAADLSTNAPATRERSDFFDEIDAQAPVRELPDELLPQQQQFIESLDGVYQVLNDPEMFGQMIRNIMIELADNPEYIKLICDQDIHTMIRAMRNTMGLAKIKKIESKSKRGSGAGRGKKALSASDAEMLSTLEGLAGFDGDE